MMRSLLLLAVLAAPGHALRPRKTSDGEAPAKTTKGISLRGAKGHTATPKIGDASAAKALDREAAAERKLDQQRQRRLSHMGAPPVCYESFIITEVADPPHKPECRFVELYSSLESSSQEQERNDCDDLYLVRSRSDVNEGDIERLGLHAVLFSSKNQAPGSNFIHVCANKEAFERCYPCQRCDIEDEDFFEDFGGDVRVNMHPLLYSDVFGSPIDGFGGLHSAENATFDAYAKAFAGVMTGGAEAAEAIDDDGEIVSEVLAGGGGANQGSLDSDSDNILAVGSEGGIGIMAGARVGFGESAGGGVMLGGETNGITVTDGEEVVTEVGEGSPSGVAAGASVTNNPGGISGMAFSGVSLESGGEIEGEDFSHIGGGSGNAGGGRSKYGGVGNVGAGGSVGGEGSNPNSAISADASAGSGTYANEYFPTRKDGRSYFDKAGSGEDGIKVNVSANSDTKYDAVGTSYAQNDNYWKITQGGGPSNLYSADGSTSTFNKFSADTFGGLSPSLEGISSGKTESDISIGTQGANSKHKTDTDFVVSTAGGEASVDTKSTFETSSETGLGSGDSYIDAELNFTTKVSMEEDSKLSGSLSVKSGASLEGEQDVLISSTVAGLGSMIARPQAANGLSEGFKNANEKEAAAFSRQYGAADSSLDASVSAELDGSSSQATAHVKNGEEVLATTLLDVDQSLGDKDYFKESGNLASSFAGVEEGGFTVYKETAYLGDGSGTMQDFVHGYAVRKCDATDPGAGFEFDLNDWNVEKEETDLEDFSPGSWCGKYSPETCQPSNQPSGQPSGLPSGLPSGKPTPAPSTETTVVEGSILSTGTCSDFPVEVTDRAVKLLLYDTDILSQVTLCEEGGASRRRLQATQPGCPQPIQGQVLVRYFVEIKSTDRQEVLVQLEQHDRFDIQALYNSIPVVGITVLCNGLNVEGSIPGTKLPPTPSPTGAPSREPTSMPSKLPTTTPSAHPTVEPTPSPTASPTAAPTAAPTASPTATPTAAPTEAPTKGCDMCAKDQDCFKHEHCDLQSGGSRRALRFGYMRMGCCRR
jgi:hypothetical protein